MISDTESISVNALEEKAPEIIQYVQTSLRQHALRKYHKACCMLPESELLLIDINNHLTKLDSTYEEVGLCNLNAWLYDHMTGVCYIGNKTAVVCANQKLIYVDVGSMKVKKEIKTDEKSKSIACNNETLYILDDYRVNTYTLNGTRLSLLYISRDDNQRRKKSMFGNFPKRILENIAVSDDGSKVYITTSYKMLITIDSSGNQLNCLPLNDPRCICVDERGNVWVGNLFGKVYQVSADGARILDIGWNVFRITNNLL